MKKKVFCKRWRIIVCISVLGMLFACTDYMLQSVGDSEWSNGNEELTISAAEKWFEKSHTPVVLTRSANGEEQLFKPHWREAKEYNRMRYEVVETPIYTQGVHIIVDNITSAYLQPGTKCKFIQNKVRLVVLRDKKTKKTRSFIMTFVGTYDYLRKKRTINKNNYLYRQPDYTGSVFFHNIDGTFINGWRYLDGKIVAELSSLTSMGNNINISNANTRSDSQDCQETCYPVYKSQCDDSYYQSGGDMESGIILDITSNCYPVFSHYECVKDCSTNDNGSNNNDNWGGSSPTGGVKDDVNNNAAAAIANLEKIYSNNSTLSKEEKIALENAIKDLSKSPFYAQLIEDLSIDVEIKFNIDPLIKGNAQYKTDGTISFANSDCIIDTTLREELIHAIQHEHFYGSDMLNSLYNFNVELEAHLFIDIANALEYKEFYYQGSHTRTAFGGSSEFFEAITSLMNSIIYEERFSSQQKDLYDEVARTWEPKSYFGKYVESFTPGTLYHYFNK